jgi:hypothetical protein
VDGVDRIDEKRIAAAFATEAKAATVERGIRAGPFFAVADIVPVPERSIVAKRAKPSAPAHRNPDRHGQAKAVLVTHAECERCRKCWRGHELREGD